MAEFERVNNIQTLLADCSTHCKGVVQLKVAGNAENLTITLASMNEAESLADLIDGYCRLHNPSGPSLWTRKGMHFLPLFVFSTFMVSVKK
jgi:focal adhesion kinase 1